PIKLGSKLIKTDLILLNLEGMDVILGMDWMTKHKVLLDISSRAIEIDSPHHGTPYSICHNENASTLAPMPQKKLRLKISLLCVSMWTYFQMIYLECLLIETSSLLLSFNPVPPLFLRGRTECLQMS